MTLVISTIVLFFIAGINAVIEAMVALSFGLRKRAEIIAVIGINAITNPTMNYLLLTDQFLTGKKSDNLTIFLLEVLVVIVEWKLLVYILGGDSKRMFRLSLLMNLVSLGIGLAIFLL
jgi:hypothetical protein